MAAAVGGEQADLGGAVEQGDACLACQATHLGQAPILLGVTHYPQYIHVHEALEEVRLLQKEAWSGLVAPVPMKE